MTDRNTLLAELRAAGDEFKTLRDQVESAKARLQPLMVQYLRIGGRGAQKTVIEVSGYTREAVRLLARKHGIEPE